MSFCALADFERVPVVDTEVVESFFPISFTSPFDESVIANAKELCECQSRDMQSIKPQQANRKFPV